MEFVGIALVVAVMLFVIVALVVVFVVVKAVQASVRRAADRALSAVVDIGQQQLAKGVDNLGKSIGQEMLKNNPRRMETEAIKLAKAHAGELSVSNVMAELNVDEGIATKTMESLMRQKLCIPREGGDGKTFVFPAFRKKVEVRICDFCGATYEPDKVESACPSCGAKLRIASTFT